MFQTFVSTSRICARREVVRYIVVSVVTLLRLASVLSVAIGVSLKFGKLMTEKFGKEVWLARYHLLLHSPKKLHADLRRD